MTTAVRKTWTAARYGRRFRDFLLRRRGRAVWICAIFAFVVAAVSGIQPPSVHDEFSYLLSGDTFAKGRLTNPTHPMWRHFETFHVLQTPTYTSKYPPGQGLALALGQRVAGSPGVGVWISYALMIAALTWMLQAWVPPRWALWGGIVASIWMIGKHAFDGYWASTYWGGSVAAAGGALVLGGVRRLARAPTIGASLAFGVGLALLANTRPFEGIFFALVPLIGAGWLVLAHALKKQWRPALITAVPATGVLMVSAVLMALHNKATTGSTTEFPYQTYYRTYDSSPSIVGQRAPPGAEYSVAALETFYTEGAGRSSTPQAWSDVPEWLWDNSEAVRNYFAPVMVLPLVFALPWVIRGVWGYVALGSLLFTTIAMSLILFAWMPHYAAPATGAITILYINSARFFRQIHRRGIRFGRSLTTLILSAVLLSATLQVTASRLPRNRQSWRWERERIMQRLAADGRHYVLVEYGPAHHPNLEWVYNGADIDAAPVIWGRSLGASEDEAFARYFRARRGWRLRIENDSGPFELSPLER